MSTPTFRQHLYNGIAAGIVPNDRLATNNWMFDWLPLLAKYKEIVQAKSFTPTVRNAGEDEELLDIMVLYKGGVG